MPRIRSDDQVLSASLAATWALVSSGGRASVAELADAAGVSTRTFHRMFPRKEDCIRPALADARRLVAAVFAEQPAELDALEAFHRAFASAAGGAFAERTRLLMVLLARDPHLTAVWEHELTFGRAELAGALLARGDETDERRAETRGAMLLAIAQLALSDVASGADAPGALRARLAGAGYADAAAWPRTQIPHNTKHNPNNIKE
jgi:AcrR family transcriptional regulator